MKNSKSTEERIAFTLKQLEHENRRFKRMVPDLGLDKEMLQEVIRKAL